MDKPIFGKWIKVEDRLPEVEHAVLMYYFNDYDLWEIVHGYYSTHYEPCWCLMNGFVIYPTHWMPLPEPPVI